MVFRDTGEGMTEETLQEIWNPLFTTKAKGMGYGLPIAKRFVEEHGGSISVESRLGEGTTLTVTLPIKHELKGELKQKWALSLYSSLSAFDEDCDVVDDYFGHEFEFLVVSSVGGESVA
jgi:hypothetical protein